MPDFFKWSFRQNLLALSILAVSTLPPHPPLYADDLAPSVATTRPTIYPNPQPDRYLFEDQLAPGMKGYGLTVMHGGKIEKFSVEIIDVIHNFSPGNNVVLVRCTGLGLEHSGIIAGMSGSPVFIKDRMIGAVAYGWGMSKDPIGGVQPIRQMLSIRAKVPATQSAGVQATQGFSASFLRQAAALPGWKTLAALMSRRVGQSALLTNSAIVDVNGVPGSLHPLSSPLMIGNASPSTLRFLHNSLADSGLVPLASGSAGSTPDADTSLGGLADTKPADLAFAPGSAIALPLVSGDMDMSAIGTVTEVRDGKVYAFGHNFMGSGPIDLPISTAYIFTVLPNVSESFKMGTSVALGGTLVSDEQTGIVGLEGPSPSTVPVSLLVHTADGAINRTYHYQLAPHPKLTTEMMGAILSETLSAQRVFPTQYTAHLTGDMIFNTPDGPRTIKIDQLGTEASFNPVFATLPISVLSENPYHNLALASVDLHAEITPENRSAEIRTITVDRLVAAPGDDVTATVELVPYHGTPRKMNVTLTVPEETEDGDYAIFVGSSAFALGEESGYAPQHFDPHDLPSTLTAVDRILAYKSDRLYAGLILGLNGVAVGGRDMANLPVSKMALYTSDRRSDATPLLKVVRIDIAADAVLESGGQMFSLHVDRHADRRYYNPHAGMSGMSGPAAVRGHMPTDVPPPATDPSDSP